MNPETITQKKELVFGQESCLLHHGLRDEFLFPAGDGMENFRISPSKPLTTPLEEPQRQNRELHNP